MTERTGRDGRSEFFLGTGQIVGTYSFAVTVNRPIQGDSVKVVTISAVAGRPVHATVNGDNQSAAASTRLAQPLSLSITDEFGNPTAAISVRWSVISGSGSATDSITITNGNGVVTNHWDLGSLIGVQTLQATIDTLPPILFTATAN
jgi:hypothetical protein